MATKKMKYNFLIPNTKYQILNTLISCLFLATCFLITTKVKVRAQSFSSDSYRIEWGNFNMTSGKKTSDNYKLTDTVGQNAPGKYTNDGYIVKSGFQYIHDTFYKFSFEIDNLSIAFGTLVPGVGSTASNIITVSSPASQGYQIMAHENHAPMISAGVTIPDTHCNNNNSCTESSSGTWDSSSAYGFGFNVIGINNSGTVTNVGTSNYFADNTNFRHFANFSASPPEVNQIIMSEDSPVKEHSARVTYKFNISPVQSAGNYENAIVFIAVPKY